MAKLVILAVMASLVLGGCGHRKVGLLKSSRPDSTDTNKSLAVRKRPNDCDSSLWLHVWEPSRLKIIELCITVTGIITKVKADEDGDSHMRLRLDEGQENLLNEGNMEDKKGELVLEIVCANEIQKDKARKPCEGYINGIKIPKVSDHVRVTGSYVMDTHNDWMEIHPVSKVEIIE